MGSHILIEYAYCLLIGCIVSERSELAFDSFQKKPVTVIKCISRGLSNLSSVGARLNSRIRTGGEEIPLLSPFSLVVCYSLNQ